MNNTFRSILFWILSFLLMALLAIYQRTTGPTYPVRGTVTIGKDKISYKLLRSWGEPSDAKIEIDVPNREISGKITYRRYKSHDDWTTIPLIRENDKLVAIIPLQPPAGKVQYKITLVDKFNREFPLTQEDVIIRFKGSVPDFFLIPHVLCMFLAMVFSTRTMIEALTKRQKLFQLSLWTFILFFIGGAILGPIIQYYAFGALWTGFPFGHDLTDNKTLVSLIFWLIAVIKLRKNPQNWKWALIAGIVMIAAYLIPHSVLGSELDYTKMRN